jgi:CRP/FNR family transcriptional regulator, cyclic AMP receptor protein
MIILTKFLRVSLHTKEKPLMAPSVPAKKKRDFDPRKFLATIGEGRKVVLFVKKQTIFTQGGAADAVFYIQKGKVKLTVVSKERQGSNPGHIE